jgi:hypothetical protein
MRLFAVPMLVVVLCAPLSAKTKKKDLNPLDPYVTAENANAPKINMDDLVVNTILFDDFIIPEKWQKDAKGLVEATENQAIMRLQSTRAFDLVGKKPTPMPSGPYYLVKATLKDYRIVSNTSRFFVGIAAGTSYSVYDVQVYDQNGVLRFQREISTEDNVFSGTFGSGDKGLPIYLGNVFADYLALRARKDMGANALPLTDQQGATTTGNK